MKMKGWIRNNVQKGSIVNSYINPTFTSNP